MQSRRDQVQAQSYVLGRLTSALVTTEPEAFENPHRRVVVGTLIGVLVACLVVAGFVVYGLLVPGGATSWREPGTLVVERESGARFVLVDGTLRPVLNYTSAILLFGQRPKLVTVSSASLSSVPRGLSFGIVGAPDTLPQSTALFGATWSVCGLSGRNPGGEMVVGTLLVLDRTPATRVLGAGDGVSVTGPDGRIYLVWGGRRFAVATSWLARVLGYDTSPPVAAGWLDQLPAGPDIRPPTVEGRGEVGPVVDGIATRVGQAFVAKVVGTPERYFMLRRDGLSPLSKTALAVVLGDPATADAYAGAPVRPVELSAAALSRLPVSALPPMLADLPQQPPAPASQPSLAHTWCVAWQGPGDTVQVTAREVSAVAAASKALGVTRTQQTATALRLGAGLGGLVTPARARAEKIGDGSLFLVTDAGVKYPIAGPTVARMLGYPPDQATAVSPQLLALLPTGPLLDPAAAGR